MQETFFYNNNKSCACEEALTQRLCERYYYKEHLITHFLMENQALAIGFSLNYKQRIITFLQRQGIGTRQKHNKRLFH